MNLLLSTSEQCLQELSKGTKHAQRPPGAGPIWPAVVWTHVLEGQAGMEGAYV